MSNDDDGFVSGMVLASILWAFILFGFKGCVDESWKTQIEAHGCGEWYLDANRDKQWQWKP